MLDAIAAITIEVSSLFLHHLPYGSFEFFGAVERITTVLTLTWLLIDKVTIGARQLKLGIYRTDGSILESWLKFQLHNSCFPDDIEAISNVLLYVQEGEQIFYKDVEFIRITPFNIHLFLFNCWPFLWFFFGVVNKAIIFFRVFIIDLRRLRFIVSYWLILPLFFCVLPFMLQLSQQIQQ